jgi:hypothetical protein
LTRGTSTVSYDLDLLRNFGQQKARESVSESVTINKDGSKTHSTSHTTNGYDASTGILKTVTGWVDFDSDDGHGNTAVGRTDNAYDQFLIDNFGLVRVEHANTRSTATNKDKSVTVTRGNVDYVYDHSAATPGEFLSATGGSNATTNDGFGNLTASDSIQTYVNANGQARVGSSVTHTFSLDWQYKEGDDRVVGRNRDGSTSDQTVTLTNYHDALGRFLGASGAGRFTSNDGYNNLTTGKINQVFATVNGGPKLLISETSSNSINKDGGLSAQTVQVRYTYDNNGVLTGASGNGNGSGDDGHGNLSTSKISQSFILLLGQARLFQTLTESTTLNRDGSTQIQTQVTDNRYQESTGLLAASSGRATFTSNDGYGNITTGHITQRYDVIRNQAKLAETVSISDTLNLNKSTSHSETTTTYAYHEDTDANALLYKAGKMKEVTGRGILLSTDPNTVVHVECAAGVQGHGQEHQGRGDGTRDESEDENCFFHVLLFFLPNK